MSEYYPSHMKLSSPVDIDKEHDRLFDHLCDEPDTAILSNRDFELTFVVTGGKLRKYYDEILECDNEFREFRKKNPVRNLTRWFGRRTTNRRMTSRLISVGAERKICEEKVNKILKLLTRAERKEMKAALEFHGALQSSVDYRFRESGFKFKLETLPRGTMGHRQPTDNLIMQTDSYDKLCHILYSIDREALSSVTGPDCPFNIKRAWMGERKDYVDMFWNLEIVRFSLQWDEPLLYLHLWQETMRQRFGFLTCYIYAEKSRNKSLDKAVFNTHGNIKAKCKHLKVKDYCQNVYLLKNKRITIKGKGLNSFCTNTLHDRNVLRIIMGFI